MLSKPCPVSRRPCPCLMLARARLGARLPFRLATMDSSAYIASSQAAPAMPAAASGAPLMPAKSAHAHATAFTVLSIAIIDKRRGLSTKSLIPRTYPVRNPIRITHARTLDVFFMHAMPPTCLGQRGSVWHCKICAANSHHTPTQCKPSEFGIDRRQQRSRVQGSSRSGQSRRIVRSEDCGRVTSTRSCPGWAPRQIDASRRESWTCVCPCVRACDGSHSTASCWSRWSIEGLCESTRSTSKERAGSLSLASAQIPF